MTDKIRVIISNSQKEVKIPTGLRMLVRRCCNAMPEWKIFRVRLKSASPLQITEQIHELNKMHGTWTRLRRAVLSDGRTANTILTQRPTPKFLEIL